MSQPTFVQVRRALAATIAGNAAVATVATACLAPSMTVATLAGSAIAAASTAGALWAWQGLRAAERRQAALTEANAVLTRLSSTDGLLGIANRRHFEMVFETEWARCLRVQQPIALLFVDVDHFKGFNDTQGHPAGDECLRRCAASMGAALRRPADLLARYGGEEFVVLLPETNLVGAHHVAGELHRAIQAEAIAHDHSPWGRVTISIGAAATVPRPELARATLVDRADAALYRAKAGGRNRTVADSMRPASVVPLAPRRVVGVL